MEQHSRFVETAKKQVAEAKESLQVLRQEGSRAAIETAELVMETNLAILQPMEAHSAYIRGQFDDLNSLKNKDPSAQASPFTGSAPSLL